MSCKGAVSPERAAGVEWKGVAMKGAMAAAIVILGALLVLVSYKLVVVENQRYALAIGMCPGRYTMPDLDCLRNVQTRTSWAWHLYYALTD